MALTQDRQTAERKLRSVYCPLAADAVIHAGALVALNAAGNLVPASVSTTLAVIGRADSAVDNTGGAAGDKSCRVEIGTFRWNNSAAADEITLADYGATVYAVDDETVALTSGTGTRSTAGVVADVDDEGVWVTHHPGL